MASMNLASPLLSGAARVAESPMDSVAFLLRVSDSAGFAGDDIPDGWLGMLRSALAGLAAALAIAIMLTVFLRMEGPGRRHLVRHGLAATLALGLFVFVANDMRHAAEAYLGFNPTKPAVEFEIRMPDTAVSTVADTQVELRTDRNQALATMQDLLASADGRCVLRGSVRLDYHTRDRVVVLNLPGHAQYQFKLRLAPSPSRSDEFGPWHLADRVADPRLGDAAPIKQHDAFAIRYRVL
jgi:hypothetical protein